MASRAVQFNARPSLPLAQCLIRIGALGALSPGLTRRDQLLQASELNRRVPGGLADLPGCDPSGADTLAVDGKSARGSRHGETPAAQLLATLTGSGLTVTQLRVPDKANEIT